jgi:hypothetical protein
MMPRRQGRLRCSAWEARSKQVTSLVQNKTAQTFLRSVLAWSFLVDKFSLIVCNLCINASVVEKLTIASMRKLSTPVSSFFRWKSFAVNTHRSIAKGLPTAALQQFLPARHLAQVRTDPLLEVWFTPSSPSKSPADDLLGSSGNGCDHKPPDERTLRLGKSEQYS